MTLLLTARDRLQQARGLASVLDAACDAFEDILAVIGTYEETTGVMAFLLVATQAANGRDAVLFAPSLPPRSRRPSQASGQPERGSADEIGAAVAGLSLLLASRLADTATAAAANGDRAACSDAARHARHAVGLLAVEGP